VKGAQQKITTHVIRRGDVRSLAKIRQLVAQLGKEPLEPEIGN
jgi:hypothetical protein